MSSQQKFLLLQGPASPFFKKLGLELIKMGHLAWKVNFCGGDKVMSWGKLPQFNFRGAYKDFNSWLTALFKEYQFTHIILFGDTRPLHIEAIKVAKSFHCQVYVYEEGYLRPDWITMEKNGVNGYSELILKNKDPSWLSSYKPLHESYSPQDSGISTKLRLLQDLIYRLATFLLLPFYPFYKTYRPRNAFIEYLGWAKRIPLKFLKKNNEEITINNLIMQNKFYYFLPLQLNSDAQIRTHSNFSNIAHMLATVLQSFAHHAKDDSLLVIKNHPFDTGLINYKHIVKKLCYKYNIRLDRVLYIENGHIPTLINHAKGVVLVNSTVGMSALFHECPTIALGESIYSLPNLTYQESLDSFWLNFYKPNIKLYRKLELFLMENNQINGNFYTKKGISMSIKGSLKILGLSYCLPLSDCVNTLLTSPAKM